MRSAKARKVSTFATKRPRKIDEARSSGAAGSVTSAGRSTPRSQNEPRVPRSPGPIQKPQPSGLMTPGIVSLVLTLVHVVVARVGRWRGLTSCRSGKLAIVPMYTLWT